MKVAYSRLTSDTRVINAVHGDKDCPCCPLRQCNYTPPLHTCGCCYKHCTCSICMKCQGVFVQETCSACHLCNACCECYSCRSCHITIAGKSKICVYCGFGRNCCCVHNEGSSDNVGGALRQRNAVNLARYIDSNAVISATMPSARLLAAEIELCGFKSNDAHVVRSMREMLASWNAQAVSDGSLPSGGVELNTHPAAGQFWVAQVSDLCTSMQLGKAWVDASAGCHIHVDCRDASYVDLAKIVRVLSCSEMLFYGMIPTQRRGNRFCHAWAWHYIKALHNAEDTIPAGAEERVQVLKYRQAILHALYGFTARSDIKDAKRHKGHDNRYRGINLHSFLHRGTIELRIPPGTIYATNIINWGFLLASLVDYAKAQTMQQVIDDARTIETGIFKMWNGTEKYMYSVKAMEQSQEYVLSVVKSAMLHDWIQERIKWAKTVGDHYEGSPE